MALKNLCSCPTKSLTINQHKENCLFRIEMDGYKAFQAGLMPEDCPFNETKEKRKFKKWMDGYIMADVKECGGIE